MIKAEVLFPEICNLFGNTYNIKYLKQSQPDIEVVETALTDTPLFVREKVDLIYMAPMTERSQVTVIEKLRPYKERIKELIEDGTVFLIIGNALEVFGDYIEDEDGNRTDALGITGLHAKKDMMHRYNSIFLGEFEDTKIVGFKSQFAMSYGDNSDKSLFTAIRGDGINKDTKCEGVRINNFFATYVLGPILVFNPDFTVYLLKLLGVENPKPAFLDAAKECYDIRLKEFEDPKVNLE